MVTTKTSKSLDEAIGDDPGYLSASQDAEQPNKDTEFTSWDSVLANDDSDVMAVAGTMISVSQNLPVTYDAAGYSALPFVRIGEVTDGGEHGREYTEIKHSPIDTEVTTKFKGGYDEGTKTLKMAISRKDAGQQILSHALVSKKDFAFCIKYPDGGCDYFIAKVMKYKKATTSVSDILSATVDLSISSSKSGVGIVEVDPPASV